MADADNFIDEIQRDKIINARRISPERRIRAGLELFDLNRQLVMAALKMQHPDVNEAALNKLFLERLAMIRRVESGL